ncbi:helix-turn-helix transcriptional regulator [Brucella sp. C7-11G]
MATRIKNQKYLTIGDICERYGVSRATVYNWKKKEPGFPDPVTISGRLYFSEYALDKWDAARGGVDPDVDGRILGLKPVSGVITDYQQFTDAMVKRRTDLNMSSMELDAQSGMQEGYASKLENYGRPQGRGMGPETFPLWLGGVRVGIVLVDLPRRPRRKT